MSARGKHSLALKAAGTLWRWGSYGDLQDTAGMTSDTPIQVGTAGDWVAFAAGTYHDVAVRNDGTLWTWGRVGLGVGGSIVNQAIPAQVGTGSDWAAVAAGRGYSLAIKRDGTLWTWADNGLWVWGDHRGGQLRLGDVRGRVLPVQLGKDRDWFAVAAGDKHALALKRNGTLRAWGSNSDSQLGIDRGWYSATPVEVRGL